MTVIVSLTGSQAALFSNAPYGDALLSFRNASINGPGTFTDVLVDLGVINASTGSFMLDLGTTGQVASAYSSAGVNNWYARPAGEILWGVIGSDYKDVSTVYDPDIDDFVTTTIHAGNGSVIASSPFAANSAWNLNADGVGKLSTKVGQMAAMDGTVSSVNNSRSQVLQTLLSSGGGFDPLFSQFEGGQTGNGVAWASTGVNIGSSALSRYLYNYDSSGTPTLLGTLALNSGNGVFTYTAAVPEPSTYALFGFGALLLVIAYRRKVA